MRRFLPHLVLSPLPLPRNTSSHYITPLRGESWAVQMVTEAIFLLSFYMHNVLSPVLAVSCCYIQHMHPQFQAYDLVHPSLTVHQQFHGYSLFHCCSLALLFNP